MSRKGAPTATAAKVARYAVAEAPQIWRNKRKRSAKVATRIPHFHQTKAAVLKSVAQA